MERGINAIRAYEEMKYKIDKTLADLKELLNRDDGSSGPDCSLIVTDGDRVLCEDCHREGFDEQDPMTHFYSAIDHGVCDSCGLEIKMPSEMETLNDIKSVTISE